MKSGEECREMCPAMSSFKMRHKAPTFRLATCSSNLVCKPIVMMTVHGLERLRRIPSHVPYPLL